MRLLGDHPERFEPFDGYIAPPLDGIWITAPYLHNGSVPDLETLLNSKEHLYIGHVILRNPSMIILNWVGNILFRIQPQAIQLTIPICQDMEIMGMLMAIN